MALCNDRGTHTGQRVACAQEKRFFVHGNFSITYCARCSYGSPRGLFLPLWEFGNGWERPPFASPDRLDQWRYRLEYHRVYAEPLGIRSVGTWGSEANASVHGHEGTRTSILKRWKEWGEEHRLKFRKSFMVNSLKTLGKQSADYRNGSAPLGGTCACGNSAYPRADPGGKKGVAPVHFRSPRSAPRTRNCGAVTA